MRLVMHYGEGDGCTYSCDVNVPFNYESAEQALIDFEIALHAAQKNQTNIEFMGIGFDLSTFVQRGNVFLPDFYTLDEWFDTFNGQV